MVYYNSFFGESSSEYPDHSFRVIDFISTELILEHLKSLLCIRERLIHLFISVSSDEYSLKVLKYLVEHEILAPYRNDPETFFRQIRPYLDAEVIMVNTDLHYLLEAACSKSIFLEFTRNRIIKRLTKELEKSFELHTQKNEVEKQENICKFSHTLYSAYVELISKELLCPEPDIRRVLVDALHEALYGKNSPLYRAALKSGIPKKLLEERLVHQQTEDPKTRSLIARLANILNRIKVLKNRMQRN